MVMFKWKRTATLEEQSTAEKKLTSLKKDISEIVSLSTGKQVSPEGLGKDFNLGLVVTFNDARGRDAYIVHPAHKKVVEYLQPILEDVIVLDYEF
jgi:hypothetical protein